jgi:hypothetical protein
MPCAGGVSTVVPVDLHIPGCPPKGYIASREQRVGRTARRVYRATPLGRKALGLARLRVRELFGELVEAH